MSTKKQLRTLEELLEEGHDLIMKGSGIIGDAKDELNELMGQDFDKAEETSGIVSSQLEEKANILANTIDLLDGAVEELETTSRDILYALQDLT